ncbi:hypothetical protein CFP56_026853 [Quercus suber]|uniref:Lsm14-like N-terminal domain-containing protein n=1 Tax=Quercus suber TaxID=58331 RepID=A0AAW0LZ12_QUESU
MLTPSFYTGQENHYGTMESIYGSVEVFSLENGLYLIKFGDLRCKDNVVRAQIRHIANECLILCKPQSGMQLLDIFEQNTNLNQDQETPNCILDPTRLSHVASGVSKPL